MIRVVAMAALAAAAALGQTADTPDAFAKVPFDQWLAGDGHTAFLKWNARVTKPELSFHQRLAAQVEVTIDGKELSKRRGEGDLLIFVQLRDEQDRHFRSSGSISLSKLDENIRKAEISYTHSMFVMPGDYRLDVALFDTASGEHSVRQSRFRVAGLKDEPLPNAWKILPAVEFTSSSEPPESWFLPEIHDRLQLEPAVQKPLRIDVLANISPTERAVGSRNPLNANLSALLPTLKTLAHAGSGTIHVNVEMIDLARQKVGLRSSDVRELDWSVVKGALEESSSGKIDLKSLEERHQRAAFLTAELKRVIGEDTLAQRVVVVLTNPVIFEGSVEPLAVKTPPNCRIIYIRLRSRVATRRRMSLEPRPSRRMPPPSFPDVRQIQVEIDQLEPLLRPLRPEVFDVETAEQARKAIARVIGLE